MRVRDWSSDVCSSDLAILRRFVLVDHEATADRVVVAGGDHVAMRVIGGEAHAVAVEGELLSLVHHQVGLLVEADPLRRAAWRGSGCQYVSSPVVAVTLQKKIKTDLKIQKITSK